VASAHPPERPPDEAPEEPLVGELLDEGRRHLAATGVARREAALLLARLLGAGEAQLLARDRERAAPGLASRYRDWIARRAAGEPAAYLLGEREFYGRPFSVDRRVLVPRPETELLVEAGLALPLPARPRLLDIGTGSGCLAVTLALELPEARVTATDRSPGALAVAARNTRRHGVAGRLRLVATDLAAGLPLSRFDLIVTNPPYVDPRERDGLPATVRDFEPPEALFAPGHGLSVWLRLLGETGAEMAPGTWIAGEIGSGQLPALARAAESSALALERAVDDLAGIPRVVILRRRA